MNQKGKFALVEIFILIIGIFAFGYLTQIEGETKFENEFMGTLLKIIIGFFKIRQIGTVSALTNSCCPKTNTGNICQEVLSDYGECAEDLIDSRCEDSDVCEIGCCIDGEGVCAEKAPKDKCLEDGGKWENEANCLLAECEKGCCVLGNQVPFVEKANCNYLSSIYGFDEKNFEEGNELTCIGLSATHFNGACTSANEECKFVSEQECLTTKGIFHQDYLCSHPSLNSGCVKQTRIECIEGEDKIYWIDSCGNRENIYDKDKTKSWNGGKILSETQSCNSGSSNANSKSCGNCNHYLGSTCGKSTSGVSDGDYICKDLNCVDPETGKTRKNGESWCAYDGFIGDGKDVVGSRHWRRICIDGEIEIDPCADYRGQICVENEIVDGDISFSISSCIVNQAMTCTSYNSLSNMKDLCYENSQCDLKQIHIDKFKFDFCTGKYPPGLDLKDPEAGNQERCGMMTTTCTIVDEKKLDSDDDFSHWENLANGNCGSKAFWDQMNDVCISLGDCGTQVNIAGEGTDNGISLKSPNGNWTDYINYSKVVEGQKANPPRIDEFPDLVGKTEAYTPEENEVNAALQQIASVSGGAGLVVAGLVKTGVIGTTYLVTAGEAAGKVVADTLIGDWMVSQGVAIPVGSNLAAIGTALKAFAIYAGIGFIVAMAFGLSGDAITVTVVTSVVGGFVGGAAIGGKLGAWGGPIGALIGALIGVAISEILGLGDIKEIDIEFTCLPWQAPTENQKCGECNSDPLKPCSKYRCESLGQACRILNENTENVVCEQIENDNFPPVITPSEIQENLKFTNEAEKKVEIRTDSGNCIKEFSKINFNLSIDEYAQCKYNFERDANYQYKLMKYYPKKGNLFSEEHEFNLVIPGLDSLEIENLIGDIKKRTGELNMYIRCMDINGNYNLEEYVVNFCIESGPDLTAPKIDKFVPKDNSHLKYGETSHALRIELNEPAECKWDLVPEKEYDLMQNQMNCNTKVTGLTNQDWSCDDMITDLNQEENKIYIKCLDQPWLKGTPESSKRVSNKEDTVFTFKKTSTPLTISSIFPTEDISRGTTPTSVNLEIKTKGGAKAGVADCYWSLNDSRKGTSFLISGSTIHKQKLSNRPPGKYKIYFTCVDAGNNIAKGETEFRLRVDKEAPKPIRLYKEGSSLVIETDEEAECSYNTKTSNFDLEEEGVGVTVGFSRTHEIDCELGRKYFVKCRDAWGRTGNIELRCV
jgi:hypothetical protein